MASIKESWSPKDYLKQYYTLEKLSTDEVKLFKYIIDFLDKFPRNYFENFIDFGAGPTVHRLIPFAFHVKNIYIADYNTENLKEIENWIKELGNAHGWDDQVRHILKLKHQSNASKNFNLYKKTIRGKIKKLMVCDILKTQPIKIKKKFDCLASFYCADSITPSKKVWERAMKNMLGLVKPGGWIILAALRKTKSYRVGRVSFPSPNIDEKDIKKVLVKNDFDPSTINVKIIGAEEWKKEGIKSLMIVKAQKNEIYSG